MEGKHEQKVLTTTRKGTGTQTLGCFDIDVFVRKMKWKENLSRRYTYQTGRSRDAGGEALSAKRWIYALLDFCQHDRYNVQLTAAAAT